MVVTWQSRDGAVVRVLAKGNFSLDAGGLVNLLLALAAVSLFLAGLLAWQGYWPVLAIAVVQLLLVGWILVRAWQKAWVSELIEIRPDRIVVEHSRHGQERRLELDTAWAVAGMNQPDVDWYPPRVCLRSGRRELELGAFLTGEEKQLLLRHLKSAIEKHSAMKGAI